MAVRHTFDRPGPSKTDQAADAAFNAIDSALEEFGEDPSRSFVVVMVLIPDGKMENSTVASHMPGEPSTEALLEHAVTQLSVVAAECGYEIRLHPTGN